MTPILLDTVVFIIITLSVLVALFRGFVKEVLTIANLAGASFAAYALAPLIAPSFKTWLLHGAEPGDKTAYVFGVIPPEAAGIFLAYATVFFGVFLLLSLAGMAISGGVKAIGLGGFDKVLGALFGAVRGFLIVFLIYAPFAFAMTPSQFPDWVKNSLSYDALNATYKAADGYMHDVDIPKADEPADPDSLRGKLENMAKDGMEKAGDASESAADSLSKSGRDLLDDEKGE